MWSVIFSSGPGWFSSSECKFSKVSGEISTCLHVHPVQLRLREQLLNVHQLVWPSWSTGQCPRPPINIGAMSIDCWTPWLFCNIIANIAILMNIHLILSVAYLLLWKKCFYPIVCISRYVNPDFVGLQRRLLRWNDVYCTYTVWTYQTLCTFLSTLEFIAYRPNINLAGLSDSLPRTIWASSLSRKGFFGNFL